MPMRRLQPEDAVAALSQGIIKVLQYSSNPTFIQSCFNHLEATTLEEAGHRMKHQLWSILHKYQNIDIPPGVAAEIASLPISNQSNPTQANGDTFNDFTGEDMVEVASQNYQSQDNQHFFFSQHIENQEHVQVSQNFQAYQSDAAQNSQHFSFSQHIENQEQVQASQGYQSDAAQNNQQLFFSQHIGNRQHVEEASQNYQSNVAQDNQQFPAAQHDENHDIEEETSQNFQVALAQDSQQFSLSQHTENQRREIECRTSRGSQNQQSFTLQNDFEKHMDDRVWGNSFSFALHSDRRTPATESTSSHQANTMQLDFPSTQPSFLGFENNRVEAPQQFQKNPEVTYESQPLNTQDFSDSPIILPDFTQQLNTLKRRRVDDPSLQEINEIGDPMQMRRANNLRFEMRGDPRLQEIRGDNLRLGEMREVNQGSQNICAPKVMEIQEINPPCPTNIQKTSNDFSDMDVNSSSPTKLIDRARKLIYETQARDMDTQQTNLTKDAQNRDKGAQEYLSPTTVIETGREVINEKKRKFIHETRRETHETIANDHQETRKRELADETSGMDIIQESRRESYEIRRESHEIRANYDTSKENGEGDFINGTRKRYMPTQKQNPSCPDSMITKALSLLSKVTEKEDKNVEGEAYTSQDMITAAIKNLSDVISQETCSQATPSSLLQPSSLTPPPSSSTQSFSQAFDMGNAREWNGTRSGVLEGSGVMENNATESRVVRRVTESAVTGGNEVVEVKVIRTGVTEGGVIGRNGVTENKVTEEAIVMDEVTESGVKENLVTSKRIKSVTNEDRGLQSYNRDIELRGLSEDATVSIGCDEIKDKTNIQVNNESHYRTSSQAKESSALPTATHASDKEAMIDMDITDSIDNTQGISQESRSMIQGVIDDWSQVLEQNNQIQEQSNVTRIDEQIDMSQDEQDWNIKTHEEQNISRVTQYMTQDDDQEMTVGTQEDEQEWISVTQMESNNQMSHDGREWTFMSEQNSAFIPHDEEELINVSQSDVQDINMISDNTNSSIVEIMSTETIKSNQGDTITAGEETNQYPADNSTPQVTETSNVNSDQAVGEEQVSYIPHPGDLGKDHSNSNSKTHSVDHQDYSYLQKHSDFEDTANKLSVSFSKPQNSIHSPTENIENVRILRNPCNELQNTTDAKMSGSLMNLSKHGVKICNVYPVEGKSEENYNTSDSKRLCMSKEFPEAKFTGKSHLATEPPKTNGEIAEVNDAFQSSNEDYMPPCKRIRMSKEALISKSTLSGEPHLATEPPKTNMETAFDCGDVLNSSTQNYDMSKEEQISESLSSNSAEKDNIAERDPELSCASPCSLGYFQGSGESQTQKPRRQATVRIAKPYQVHCEQALSEGGDADRESLDSREENDQENYISEGKMIKKAKLDKPRALVDKEDNYIESLDSEEYSSDDNSESLLRNVSFEKLIKVLNSPLTVNTSLPTVNPPSTVNRYPPTVTFPTINSPPTVNKFPLTVTLPKVNSPTLNSSPTVDSPSTVNRYPPTVTLPTINSPPKVNRFPPTVTLPTVNSPTVNSSPTVKSPTVNRSPPTVTLPTINSPTVNFSPTANSPPKQISLALNSDPTSTIINPDINSEIENTKNLPIYLQPDASIPQRMAVNKTPPPATHLTKNQHIYLQPDASILQRMATDKTPSSVTHFTKKDVDKIDTENPRGETQTTLLDDKNANTSLESGALREEAGQQNSPSNIEKEIKATGNARTKNINLQALDLNPIQNPTLLDSIPTPNPILVQLNPSTIQSNSLPASPTPQSNTLSMHQTQLNFPSIQRLQCLQLNPLNIISSPLNSFQPVSPTQQQNLVPIDSQPQLNSPQSIPLNSLNPISPPLNPVESLGDKMLVVAGNEVENVVESGEKLNQVNKAGNDINEATWPRAKYEGRLQEVALSPHNLQMGGQENGCVVSPAREVAQLAHSHYDAEKIEEKKMKKEEGKEERRKGEMEKKSERGEGKREKMESEEKKREKRKEEEGKEERGKGEMEEESEGGKGKREKMESEEKKREKRKEEEGKEKTRKGGMEEESERGEGKREKMESEEKNGDKQEEREKMEEQKGKVKENERNEWKGEKIEKGERGNGEKGEKCEMNGENVVERKGGMRNSERDERKEMEKDERKEMEKDGRREERREMKKENEGGGSKGLVVTETRGLRGNELPKNQDKKENDKTEERKRQNIEERENLNIYEEKKECIEEEMREDSNKEQEKRESPNKNEEKRESMEENGGDKYEERSDCDNMEENKDNNKDQEKRVDNIDKKRESVDKNRIEEEKREDDNIEEKQDKIMEEGREENDMNEKRNNNMNEEKDDIMEEEKKKDIGDKRNDKKDEEEKEDKSMEEERRGNNIEQIKDNEPEMNIAEQLNDLEITGQFSDQQNNLIKGNETEIEIDEQLNEAEVVINKETELKIDGQVNEPGQLEVQDKDTDMEIDEQLNRPNISEKETEMQIVGQVNERGGQVNETELAISEQFSEVQDKEIEMQIDGQVNEQGGQVNERGGQVNERGGQVNETELAISEQFSEVQDKETEMQIDGQVNERGGQVNETELAISEQFSEVQDKETEMQIDGQVNEPEWAIRGQLSEIQGSESMLNGQSDIEPDNTSFTGQQSDISIVTIDSSIEVLYDEQDNNEKTEDNDENREEENEEEIGDNGDNKEIDDGNKEENEEEIRDNRENGNEGTEENVEDNNEVEGGMEWKEIEEVEFDEIEILSEPEVNGGQHRGQHESPESIQGQRSSGEEQQQHSNPTSSSRSEISLVDLSPETLEFSSDDFEW